MSPPLTDDELRAMRARCEAATPEPWEYENVQDCQDRSAWSLLVGPDGKVLADTLNSDAAVIHHEHDETGVCYWDEIGRRNFTFAAHARTDLPRLLDEVERLRAGIRKHRDCRGDDRCHLDDGGLHALLPEGDTRPARDTAVTIENCRHSI